MINLIPTTVTSADTVTALVSTSDDDGDAVTVSYAWQVDGTAVTVTASLDGAVFFDRGQEVTVTVTPNDGTTDGEPVTSEAVIVQNSAPTVDDVTIRPHPDATDALTCTYSGFADADGDEDNSTLQWTINGVPSGSSATLATATAEDDLVVYTVTPYDGLTLGAAQTATVRIDADPDADDGSGGSSGSSGSDTSLRSPITNL